MVEVGVVDDPLEDWLPLQSCVIKIDNDKSICELKDKYLEKYWLTAYWQGSSPPLANTEASAATSGLILGCIVSARKFGRRSNPEMITITYVHV